MSHPQHRKLPKEAAEALERKSEYFYRVFKSPDGQRVLEALEQTFDLDDLFVDGDPHKTSYNLGGRDVVVYIRQMIRLKEKQNAVDRSTTGRIEGAQSA